MADLVERVDAELANIEEVLSRIPPAESLASLSELELAGVAALLNSFYNGLENVLRQIMRSRSLRLPTGRSWHKELVETARSEGIITGVTREGLKNFLAFRHFFSHAYAFDVDPSRVEPLVAEVQSFYASFKDDCAKAMPKC